MAAAKPMSEADERRGRAAYEADVKKRPTYHDGSPRKPWDKLHRWAKETWAKERRR